MLHQLVAGLIFVANTILLFVRGPRRPHRPLPPPIVDQPRVDRIGTQATRLAGLSSAGSSSRSSAAAFFAHAWPRIVPFRMLPRPETTASDRGE
jgi:hypothetical protein